MKRDFGKILIENKEIIIDEKAPSEGNDEHIIGETQYTLKTTTTREITSSIYTYSDGMKALTSIVNRFGEEYFKVLLFSDNISKAWTLIELSSDLNVRVRRLGEFMFVVIGYSKDPDNKKIVSQFSFCKLMPSTMVEERTTNFWRLRGVQFASDHIVMDYDELENGKMRNVVSKYNFEGKLLSTKSD